MAHETQEATAIESVAVSLIRGYELAQSHGSQVLSVLGGLVAARSMVENGVDGWNLFLGVASAAIFCSESEPRQNPSEGNPSQ